MDRNDHMTWCKERALEYVDLNDLPSAVASMMSDLTKHPETKESAQGPLGMFGIMAATNGNTDQVRRFIDGFN